jgi:muconate cycloisomerase
MTVGKVDIWHLKLAFLLPIKHNLATHEGSENLVVKVTTEEGLSGYGEGLPRAFVTGETLAGSLAFLTEVLGPRTFQQEFTSPPALLKSLEESYQELGAVQYPAAFCAWEMALVDAAGRIFNRSAGDFFGPGLHESVTYSAVIPMAPLEQTMQFFQLVKMNRMRYLKLKVGTEMDIEMLHLAREELGWDLDIRVDANSAWTPTEAVARLKEMKPYKISAVEQPVSKGDFEGLKEVGKAVGLPIIADESLCHALEAQRLIEMRACQIFNLRLSKCGGLGQTIRIRKMAEKAGMRCQLGCHVGETSILSAAGRHFALSSPELAYVEGSFSPLLLTRDPVRQPVAFGPEGLAQALPGSGLGVEVLDEALNDLAVSHHTLER